MKKAKILKTLLIPTIVISVILPIAAVLTCCCSEDPGIDVREYVGITANANSTLTLYNEGGNNPNLEYSVDYGASWNTYSAAISIDQGKNLYLKGNNQTGWSHSGKISRFVITGDVSISGNIMGLLDNGAKPGKQGDITTISERMCFGSLFYESTAVTSVSKDFLPATSLADYCYFYMFYGCSNLTTAPELPATTLAKSCYEGMFTYCRSLNSAKNQLYWKSR